MKQKILILTTCLLAIFFTTHEAQAEISIPKKLSAPCDNEDIYKQLEFSNMNCYQEVMNKAMEYSTLAPLVMEFGEGVMSSVKVKHVKNESEKIYNYYKILIKKINVKKA